jgi:hypothetical protein
MKQSLCIDQTGSKCLSMKQSLLYVDSILFYLKVDTSTYTLADIKLFFGIVVRELSSIGLCFELFYFSICTKLFAGSEQTP